MSVGNYLNLMPHMSSWKVYVLGDAPVAGNEVGNLAPATFGGLSYRILGVPSTDLYTIETESFGTVNIYAPRDEDSSITLVPRFDNGSSPSGTGEYLNLQPHMTSWRVYPIGVSPVAGNEIGSLAPATFGGLSYRILDEPSTDLHTIETESFGRVNIYAPRDPDSTITNSPEFSNGGAIGSSEVGTGQFLNLAPHMDSWRVYPLGVSPVSGNEMGSLAPSRYGGLSYEILAQPSTNLYTILTESYGRVNIYAPRDNDSSITSSPAYVDSSSGAADGAGLYLNLFPHISSWRVYPMGVPTVSGNEIGKLGPALFGGLTYRIIGTAGADVYTILTESFGQVNIYAPRDNDSSITSSPLFGVTNANPPTGGGLGGPSTANPGGVRVFLDAGHGGHDPGAQGSGLVEKHVNLEIVKKVGDILEAKGANVFYRRYGDTYTSLDGIVADANQSDADLFISVHCNANPSPFASGVECYTYNPSPSEAQLSAAIAHAISSQTGIPNRGAKQDNFRVITYTTMPAILIETGFITNSSDAYQLKYNSSGLASAIANEIVNYLGIADGPPPLSEKDEEELKQEKRNGIIDSLMKEFPILKEVLPSAEFSNDQEFFHDFGTYKMYVTFSSKLKIPNSSSSKVLINNGKFDAEVADSLIDKIDEFGNKIGTTINAGTQGIAFASIVNNGQATASLGVNEKAQPVFKFVTDMEDIKLGNGSTTDLSLEIKVVIDNKHQKVVDALPVSLTEKLSEYLDEIAQGLIVGVTGLVVLIAMAFTSSMNFATSFLGTSTELLKILEEEIRKENA